VNKLVLFLSVCGALALNTASANASTNYFLVAEWPRAVVHGDSFVIALTNSAHISHARDLIARGPENAGSPIIVANIAAGADGLNRNLRTNSAQPWSWHVTGVTGFANFTIEILDGWPTFLESDVPGWIQNTGGRIGFWGYTVVAELPLKPRIASIGAQTSHVELSIADLTPPFGVIVQTSTNLALGNWPTQTSFIPSTMTNTLVLPRQGDRGFFRIAVQQP